MSDLEHEFQTLDDIEGVSPNAKPRIPAPVQKIVEDLAGDLSAEAVNQVPEELN